MPLALSDTQMSEVATMANRVPQHLRSAFLKRVAGLLARAHARRCANGIDFLDADVWRACQAAAREVRQPKRRPGRLASALFGRAG